MVEQLDVVFSPADVDVGDLVLLYDDASSLFLDMLKVLLGVRSYLFTGSTFEVACHSNPVSAVQEKADKELAMLLFRPVALAGVAVVFLEANF